MWHTLGHTYPARQMHTWFSVMAKQLLVNSMLQEWLARTSMCRIVFSLIHACAAW